MQLQTKALSGAPVELVWWPLGICVFIYTSPGWFRYLMKDPSAMQMSSEADHLASLHNQEACSTPGSAGQACRTCQVCVGAGGRLGWRGKRRAKGRKRGKRACHFCFTLFIYLKNFRNAKFTKIHRSRIAWIFPIVIEIPCEGLCEGGLLVPSLLPMPSLSLRSFKAPR